jgi:hypothetical protein
MTTVMNRLTSMPQRICGYKPKRVAHFLLIPELLYSPPNNAIIQAYLSLGYAVDIFSPGNIETQTAYGDKVKMLTVGYSWSWIIKNIFSFKWLSYEWISGTSEDPLAVVGIFSFVYRKKSFTLVDEIKAGDYRGDRSDLWKTLCKWGIKRAHFKIVNDKHRIELLIDYADLSQRDKIIVYPGCYVQRPETVRDSQSIKKSWGLPSNAFVIGSSGGFNLTAGADWLLESIREIKDIYAVVQPLGVSPLSIFLMENGEVFCCGAVPNNNHVSPSQSLTPFSLKTIPGKDMVSTVACGDKCSFILTSEYPSSLPVAPKLPPILNPEYNFLETSRFCQNVVSDPLTSLVPYPKHAIGLVVPYQFSAKHSQYLFVRI